MIQLSCNFYTDTLLSIFDALYVFTRNIRMDVLDRPSFKPFKFIVEFVAVLDSCSSIVSRLSPQYQMGTWGKYHNFMLKIDQVNMNTISY